MPPFADLPIVGASSSALMSLPLAKKDRFAWVTSRRRQNESQNERAQLFTLFSVPTIVDASRKMRLKFRSAVAATRKGTLKLRECCDLQQDSNLFYFNFRADKTGATSAQAWKSASILRALSGPLAKGTRAV